MKIFRVVIAGVGLLSATGCCTSYKKAVETYTSTLQKRGKLYYSSVLPELRKELVLNDASLKCLVDKDAGQTNTVACACSDGMPDDWEKNCADWLK